MVSFRGQLDGSAFPGIGYHRLQQEQKYGEEYGWMVVFLSHGWHGEQWTDFRIRDLYRSSNIVIQDIGDQQWRWYVPAHSIQSLVAKFADCVSFKPNSSEILVQNLHCNGSHGISVGSLGQYKNEVDIVENVLVYNISMSNASVRFALHRYSVNVSIDINSRTVLASKSGPASPQPCPPTSKVAVAWEV